MGDKKLKKRMIFFSASSSNTNFYEYEEICLTTGLVMNLEITKAEKFKRNENLHV